MCRQLWKGNLLYGCISTSWSPSWVSSQTLGKMRTGNGRPLRTLEDTFFTHMFFSRHLLLSYFQAARLLLFTVWGHGGPWSSQISMVFIQMLRRKWILPWSTPPRPGEMSAGSAPRSFLNPSQDRALRYKTGCCGNHRFGKESQKGTSLSLALSRCCSEQLRVGMWPQMCWGPVGVCHLVVVPLDLWGQIIFCSVHFPLFIWGNCSFPIPCKPGGIYSVCSFVTSLFHLAQCPQGSSMLYHVSDLPSYLKLHSVPLYGCAMFCLSIRSLMDTWVASTLWLLWIMLLWT